MGYFDELFNNTVRAYALARINHKLLEQLIHDVKELRQMADARLSAIDTELDGEDTILTQIEKDVASVQQEIADLEAQEKTLEDEIAANGATVDTTAEVQRIQAEKARLTTIEATLSNQLAAHTPTTPAVPATPDTNSGVVTQDAPPADIVDGTSTDPNATP